MIKLTYYLVAKHSNPERISSKMTISAINIIKSSTACFFVLGAANAIELNKATFIAPTFDKAVVFSSVSSLGLNLSSYTTDLETTGVDFETFGDLWIASKDFTNGYNNGLGQVPSSFWIELNYTNNGAQALSLNKISFEMGLGDLLYGTYGAPENVLNMEVQAQINKNEVYDITIENYDMSSVFSPTQKSTLTLELDTPITIASQETFTTKLTYTGGVLNSQGFVSGKAPVMSFISLEGVTIPEPSTVSLGLLGISALFLRRRRR